MLRSLYSGVSGMKGFQTKLDVIGNNIANVNTVGFKKSTVSFQDMLSQNLSSSGVNPMQVGLGSSVAGITVQHTNGSLMSTGVDTNLAIIGNGFFVVQDPNSNEIFLTRTGDFTIDSNGNLVTQQGYNVLAYNEDGTYSGPINLSDREYSIDSRGRIITGVDATGNPVVYRTIAIATVNNPAGLESQGGSLYKETDASGLVTVGSALLNEVEIASGQLEMSNVDLTEEFTEMIVAQRGFQANSRIITTSDEILQEVVNLKR